MKTSGINWQVHKHLLGGQNQSKFKAKEEKPEAGAGAQKNI